MFSQMIDQMEHKNKWYKFGLQTWCYKPHPTVHTLVTFSGRTLLGVRGFGLKILATDVLILDFTIYKKLLQPLQMRLDWVGSGLSMTIGGIKRLRDQAPNWSVVCCPDERPLLTSCQGLWAAWLPRMHGNTRPLILTLPLVIPCLCFSVFICIFFLPTPLWTGDFLKEGITQLGT